MNISKEHVLSTIQENQKQIKPFGVKKLGLFGSFVREEQDVESDIDFLVEFEPAQKTFDNFIHLSFYLEELFSRHIELVTPESISPYIKPHILKEVKFVTISS